MPPGRKIRVLQLIKGLDIGGVNGGAERFSIDLARALSKEHCEVAICAFFRQGTDIEKHWQAQIERDGLPLFFLTDWAGNNRFGTYLRGLSALRNRLPWKQADVCHSHFQLGTISAIYLKATGGARRAIRTAHIIQEWERGWYGWLRRQVLSNWVFPTILDAEVGVSPAVVADLSQHPGSKLSRRRPALIYNAIDVANFHPRLPGSAGIPPRKKLLVGTVGRLAEQKGHAYLFQAVKQALDELPDLECWVIGDGELRAQLEDLVNQSGLQEKILFLGRRDDVPELLHALDLFILPSLWEGLPTVLMECMASGVPILATNIPGTRDMIENGVDGWLVPPEDAGQLAGKMVELLTSPAELDRLVQNAYRSVNRFSITSIAEQYQNLYQDLLG